MRRLSSRNPGTQLLRLKLSQNVREQLLQPPSMKLIASNKNSCGIWLGKQKETDYHLVTVQREDPKPWRK